MNIAKLYEYVPQRDAFIDIEIENGAINKILPEYEHYMDSCLCIYGISESELDGCLVSVKAKVDEYISEIKEHLPNNILWDLKCKPVLLFENKETAIIFMEFANSLSDEDFNEFIDEMEYAYYEPWIHVKMIPQARIYDITDYYEERYCDD